MNCRIAFALCVATFPPQSMQAQQISAPSTTQSIAQSAELPPDTQREIWDTGFLKKRPASSLPPRSPAKAHYTARPGDRSKPSPSKNQAAIGLTVWRLRTPNAADRDVPRLLLQDGAKKNGALDLVPERIDSATPLHVGDRIRISVEVPRSGFLYVVDRERYDDHSFGPPVLIFPTSNMNHGDNEVAPGRVIEIPPQDAPFRALRVTRSTDRQIGEDLMLIVTAKKLSEISLSEKEQPLDASMVEGWDRNWFTGSVILDLTDSQNQPWSVAEQRAGGDPALHRLTQTDPLPQTIISVASDDQTRPQIGHILLNIAK